MIDCQVFHRMLSDQGIGFFTGVPDSLLKDFCAYIAEHVPASNHIIAANEGGAVALACGHYLATGNPGLVYMQNSGQGNALNPLASLADREVYGIPLLMLIGWRGEPGVRDEPQHIKQGRITTGLLDLMEIPYRVIPDTPEELSERLEDLCREMRESSMPAALIARKGSFAPSERTEPDPGSKLMSRETAIARIISALGEQDLLVSTTGGASRELYEYRVAAGQVPGRDFLTVGSMGHSSLIALGMSLARQDRDVICIDGDGAALMHLGAMPVIAACGLRNFRHVLLNNGAHDSVGGQPTAGARVSFADIARACGYRHAWTIDSERDVDQAVDRMKSAPGPAFLEVRIRKGSRPDLGRPETTPLQNRDAFMKLLGL